MTLIVGLGNAVCGDDAAGLVTASALERVLPDARVLAWEGEPIGLLDVWENESECIVIDAVVAAMHPGRVVRFDASADEIPAVYTRRGTHAMGVGEAIEVARALGRLPARLLFYGIEGVAFGAGDPMSAAVARAVSEVVDRVVTEVGARVG